MERRISVTDKDFKDYEAEAAYFASPKSLDDCGERDLICKRQNSLYSDDDSSSTQQGKHTRSKMGRKKVAERRISVSLNLCVEQGLFAKKEQAREEALSEIIKAFTRSTKHDIAKKKFATIMLRCLNSVKKGSSKEICLATKAIGLLAMILGPGDATNELFEESLSTYSQLLSFQADSVNVLECLAIVTLVGAEDFSDTERSMKVIWQLVCPDLGSNISSNEASTPVLAAAISAWSFLLTTIDGRQLDHKYWQGVISYFLNLLHEGESVRALCIEALAVILEKGCVEKFSAEAYKAFMHSFDNEQNTISDYDARLKVPKLFEEELRLKTSTHICGNSLKFSTLAQFIKFKFMKQFLGDGFKAHMMENEFLQQVFDFKVKEARNGPEIYVPENEEVNVRYFSHDIRKDKCKQKFERSPNSMVSKARTQLMKKYRVIAQERKAGDFLAC